MPPRCDVCKKFMKKIDEDEEYIYFECNTHPSKTYKEAKENNDFKTEGEELEILQHYYTKREEPPHVETLSPDESLPQYNIIIDFITLLSYDERVPLNPLKKLDELFSFFERVAKSKNRTAIMKYLLKNIATSPTCIRDDLLIPEASVYREIKKLEKWGYIEWVIPTSFNWKRKGYATGIIALPTFKPEDIIEARKREVERTRPQAKMVQRAYQLILEEFIDKPDLSTRTNIIQYVKPHFTGFNINDIIFWIDRAIEKVSQEIMVW